MNGQVHCSILNFTFTIHHYYSLLTIDHTFPIFGKTYCYLSQPSVAIVILNWNGKHYLQQFLPSVVKTSYANLRIIVADNGSTDDSVYYRMWSCWYLKKIMVWQKATMRL